MINFTNADSGFMVKNKMKVKNWIHSIVASESGTAGDITFVFCSDNYLSEMNVKYLKHDTLTDIITFGYSEKKKISGDICISVDRVKENAEKFKIDFEKELARVMAHGVLHLLGYKDKNKEDKLTMTGKEDLYLISYPY